MRKQKRISVRFVKELPYPGGVKTCMYCDGTYYIGKELHRLKEGAKSDAHFVQLVQEHRKSFKVWTTALESQVDMILDMI